MTNNEYMRKYRAEHPEIALYQKEYQKKYRIEHKNEIKELNKNWRKNNPEKVKANQDKKQGVGKLCTYRINQKKKCKELANYTCQICGLHDTSSKMHAHHIITINNGGSDELDNLMCVCENCHKKLHNHNV